MARVSVITPFHNSAEFLPECIESVLSQTFTDLEYLLVDNASTDKSLAIAEEYATRDTRIRVIHFDELLPQVPNYNRALRLADQSAAYCKIAQADDMLLPRCIEEMVARADSDQEIGLVGAYSISQNKVFLDGLDYYETIIDGNRFVARYLMDGPYILGNPTSHLYRMSDVRRRNPFYPECSPVEDAEAAVQLVLGRKFGFVHQTLVFCRRSNESISKRRKHYNVNVLTRRVLLEKYGPSVLDADTFNRWQQKLRRRHYRVLGAGWLARMDDGFWTLHREGLEDAGLTISRTGVAWGAIFVLLRSLFNLETTLRQSYEHLTLRER